jgi:tRNA modification GTPase
MLKLPTIFAPASGKGKSAIAILRISGPSALNIYHTITRPPTGPYRPPLPANESNQSFASTSSLLLSSDGTAASKMDMRMKNRQDPVPRRATLRKIIDPISNEILDEAIVLYFPRAYTCFLYQPT